MKILLAPNTYKGSLTADEAAHAMARGAGRGVTLRRLPLADGGDGTAVLLTRVLGGKLKRLRVPDPLGRPVLARWGLVEKKGRSLALVDMAESSGLRLLHAREKNPLRTSSFGTGLLIKRALDAGCRDIIIGIGGSATVDAGLGIAQALGARFYDRAGRPLGMGGGELRRLHRIDLSKLDPRLNRAKIHVACDVDNPLYGRNGAAFVFAPQKGASRSQVRQLDAGLRRFARLARRVLRQDVSRLVGGGAAGGAGAGLFALLGARLVPGRELVFNLLSVEEHVRWADFVFTGEGRLDATSFQGKATGVLAAWCRRFKKPLVIFAGQVDGNIFKEKYGGLRNVPLTPHPRLRRTLSPGERVSSREARRVRGYGSQSFVFVKTLAPGSPRVQVQRKASYFLARAVKDLLKEKST